MNVSLTPRPEELIQQKVESGFSNNARAVVREALRLLKTRDRELAWSRQKMADSAKQGSAAR